MNRITTDMEKQVNTKSVLLILLVVVLVVLNISAMGFIWWQSMGAMPHGPMHGKQPFAIIIDELKMTPQQQKAYLQMRDEHHAKVEEIRDSTRLLRHQLFQLLSSDSSSTAQAGEITKLIGDKQAEIDMVTYNHFKQVRSICTAGQKQRFDEIIEDILKAMAMPPPPPPGRP